jgi:hypothetical protein
MKSRFILTPLAIIFFFFSIVIVSSCAKENSGTTTDAEEVQVSQTAGESDAEAETTFNEFFEDAMGANNDVGIAGSGVFYGRLDTLVPVPRCFTTTITHPTTNFFPVIVVLDFGTSGCPGPDGRIRRGKIITEYTNRLVYPGAIATTSFDGFYVDDVHVEGTHKITNTSAGTSNRQFAVEVRDAKLTKPTGDYIKWNSDRVITQIEGIITPDFHDDIFSITGSGQGQVKRGTLLAGWQSSTTEPLIKRLTCRWIVKGRIRTVRVNSNPTGSSVAVLDFGNGNCDNLAIITINGVSHQITLP